MNINDGDVAMGLFADIGHIMGRILVWKLRHQIERADAVPDDVQ